MTDVVIFTTSVATNWKTKKDTYRIKQLLDTKKVPYTEVGILKTLVCRVHTLRFGLGQQRGPYGQVDLALEPLRRSAMRDVGQCATIPQVHAKGKVSVAAAQKRARRQPLAGPDICCCSL